MRKYVQELFLYGLVSVVALGVDFFTLLQLADKLHYLLAATIAFFLGSLVHYALSVSLVFKTRRMLDNRHAERILYIAAGVAGLLVNWAIIAASIEFFSLSLTTGKILASGVSFFVGYLIRKVYLFSQPQSSITV